MTPFKNIYNLALVTITDYKIKKLLATDEAIFYEYMRSLLSVGIPEFSGCLQSLDYTSQQEIQTEDGEIETVWYFVNDLTSKEQAILARLIIIKWWEQKLQDVVVFQGAIPTRDYTKMEIATGLKQKSEYKDKLYEEVSRLISDYITDNLASLPFFGGV